MRAHLLLVALALACAPQDGGDTGQTTTNEPGGSSTSAGSSDATSVPTTGEPVGACDPPRTATDDCCCFTASVTEDDLPVVTNTCPAAAACPEFPQFECASGCPAIVGSGNDGAVTVSDEAALDCVLAALRDGTPGRVGWTFSASGGFFRHDADHYIQADRTVLGIISQSEDSDRNYYDTARRTLKPAEYFSDCLGVPDPGARALCLAEITTDDALETCLDGSL